MTISFRNSSTAILLVALCFCFGVSSVTAQQPKTITNSIGMKLVLIPAGTFTMGSPPSEEGSDDDERQHEVTLTQDYYLGAFEVTQAQYEKVMGKNFSCFRGDTVAEKIPAKKHPKTGRTIEDEKIIPVDSSNHPVEWVSWKDAVEFCKKLSALPGEKRAGRVYRLPTEAEWEYACRAGSRTAFSFGESSESLSDYAWFRDNSDRKTHPVGKKIPNAWGLYDMHGNVREWCSDFYADYPRVSATNPTGPGFIPTHLGPYRVLRGGAWDKGPDYCRSAGRGRAGASSSNNQYGFRVALSSSGIPK